MQNLVNSNKSFARMIRIIRKVMPALAAALLIGVYVVSAIAGGMFLAQLMAAMSGGIALAYAIGAAIQATRASLVFFAQLNPTRPSFSHVGEVIAVIMGVISIAEILSLVSAAGLPYPVAISLSILMAAGVGIELFLLREVRFITEMQLFSDRSYWGELRDFYKARNEFRAFLDQLKDQAIEGSPLISEPSPAREIPSDGLTEETRKQIAEAEALVQGENLHRVKIVPDLEAQEHYERYNSSNGKVTGNGRVNPL